MHKRFDDSLFHSASQKAGQSDQAAQASRKSTSLNVEPGRRYTLLYPQHPYHGIPSLLVPHFVEIDRVSDTRIESLDSDHFAANPLLLRSRFRIMATDIATGAKVEFFDKWIHEVHEVAIAAFLPAKVPA